MAAPATRSSDADVAVFLESVPNEHRRGDGKRLRSLMEKVTGAEAAMWGPSMVGFGATSYTNTTGTHDWFVVGFSPRKTALSVYGIFNEHGSPDPLFEGLGPHTTGKGCVYIKRLADLDQTVLESLITQAWDRAHGTENP